MGIETSLQLFINRTSRFWRFCNRLQLGTHHLDSISKFRQVYDTQKLGLYDQECAYTTVENHNPFKTNFLSLKYTKAVDLFSKRTAKLNRFDFPSSVFAKETQNIYPLYLESGLMSNHASTGDIQRVLLSNNSFISYPKTSLLHGQYSFVRHYTTGRDQSLPIIYLFTKEECTLCDQAKEMLKPYRHRFTLEEVDITLPENADWYEKYKYDIPVFHMYEDFLFMHKVDLGILEQALKQHEDKAK